jgi:hypothetical protein
MALFSYYSGVARQDCLFNDLGFQTYYKENSLWKLLLKFERDPIVGSKVLDLFSYYSGVARQDRLFNE